MHKREVIYSKKTGWQKREHCELLFPFFDKGQNVWVEAKYPNMRFGNCRLHDSRTELADQCDASGAGLNPLGGGRGKLDSIDVGALLAGLAVVGAIPSVVEVGSVE